MNEKQLLTQRDLYWMLCVVLMILVIILLLFIGGHHLVGPNHAVWKDLGFESRGSISTTTIG